MNKVNLKSIGGKKIFNTGFGLIELMVSISIMILVTSVVIARQDSFNGATLLRSQAYAIALGVREVQLQAVSATGDIDGNFRNVYGLYFDTSNSANTFYKVFKDNGLDPDTVGVYEASKEYGKQGILDKRFQIDAIRLIGGSVTTQPSSITILFKRPNFDAEFYDADGNKVANSVSGIEIDVRVRGSETDDDGVTAVRTVEVTKAGQITVKHIN